MSRSSGGSHETSLTPAQLQVQKSIHQISQNIPQISQIIQKMGTLQDSHELRETLRTLLAKTRNLIRDTSQKTKQLEKSDDDSSVDPVRKKMLQAKLSKDVQIWSQKFQEVFKVAAQKEKDFPLPHNHTVAPIRGIGMPDSNPFLLEEENEEERKNLLPNARVQEVLRQDAEREILETELHERQESIKRIHKTVLEVNEISRDINTLVVEQGAMIENIETHVNTSAAMTDRGLKEIEEAQKQQKSGRTKMCWVLLIIIIVSIIILAIIIIPILIRISF